MVKKNREVWRKMDPFLGQTAILLTSYKLYTSMSKSKKASVL
jgi:hypothetical protein